MTHEVTSEQPKQRAGLRDRWARFADIAIDPWTVLLIVGVGGVYWFSLTEGAKEAQALALVVLSLASAVLGGRVTHDWARVRDGGVVAASGQTAVRSLILLIQNVTSLESRVQKFLRSQDHSVGNAEIIKRNYEEILEKCASLIIGCESSIENWTDIVPDAKRRSDLSAMVGLKAALDQSQLEKEGLSAELRAAQATSSDQEAVLKAQVASKDREIATLKAEMNLRKASFVGGLSDVGIQPARLGLRTVSHDDLERMGAFGKPIIQEKSGQ